MNRGIATFFAISLLAGCASAPVQVAPPAASSTPPSHTSDNRVTTGNLSSPLAARIADFLAQPRFEHADWGISVISLDSGRTLYGYDADKLFVPASNAKLYTAALALSDLGSDARFTTTLYATGSIGSSGALAGDLILAGGGDPSLGDPQVSPDWADQLASALATRGVHRVQGDLVADDSWFAGPSFGHGWEAGDLQTWYAVPASALSVRGNVARVRVSRSNERCCEVNVEPVAAGLQIKYLTGSEGEGSDTLNLYRPPGSDTIYASGSLSARATHRTYALSVPDPALLAGNLLRDALAQRGITLSGTVRPLHWPQLDSALGQPGVSVIGTITSPPLTDLIQHMLKDSDNLYAQVLMQQVGVRAARSHTCADRAQPPVSSADWGLCAMRAMLTRIGIANDSATFEEGTGLSRKDLITPAATTRLLAWIASQPFSSTFRNSLPVAGVDGTLKHRFIGTQVANNLRAKTGTLSRAYALSGYVTNATGEHLAFSLLLDHYQRPTDSLGRNIRPSPTSDLDEVAEMLAGAVR